MSMNINVAVRIRPLNKKEIKRGDSKPWRYDNSSIYQYDEEQNKPIGNQYFFDRVYNEEETSFDIYNHTAKNIVMSSLEGINGTIFAYGQTASGKTFTMRGTDDHPGIIQLAINDIFDHIKKTTHREFLVKVSYLEIYNEVITDLLNPDNTKLKIHETSERGIFVGGAKEEVVVNAKEMMSILKKGDLNRKVGQTNMSEKSSRSHSIFRIVITSRSIETSKHELKNQKGKRRLSSSPIVGSMKVSLLNLVDLAGSERIAHTGAEGVRLKEGAHINKSLFTLERVINKLSDPKSMLGHIPFRDSKLTRILQTALGGNSKTAIICTMTPSSLYVDESNMTLKFASCAKNIITRPEVNEIIADQSSIKVKYEKKIQSLKDEIALLTTKLESNNDIGQEEREEELILLLDETRRELEQVKNELKLKQDEIKLKNQEIERIKRIKRIDDDLNDEEIMISNELINELEEYNKNIQYLGLKGKINKEKDETVVLLKEKIHSLEKTLANHQDDMKKEKEISLHRLQEIREIEKSLDNVNKELENVRNEYDHYKHDMELKIDQIKTSYELKVKDMEDKMNRMIQRDQMNVLSMENHQKKLDEMKKMYIDQINDIESKYKDKIEKIDILEEEKKRLEEERSKLEEEKKLLDIKYEEKAKESLKRLEESLLNIEKELENEKNDHLKTKDELLSVKEQLNSLKNDYDVLKFENDIKTRSNYERDDKIKTLEEQIDCLKEEKEQLIVMNKIIEEKLENEKIKSESYDLNRKLSSYDSMDIEWMKKKIEQYEYEKNEDKKKIESYEDKIRKMEESLEHLQRYKLYAKQKKDEAKMMKDALDQMKRNNEVQMKQIERLRKENHIIKYGSSNIVDKQRFSSIIRDENHINQ